VSIDFRVVSYRLMRALFILAMIVMYGGLLASILGVADARRMALVNLSAAAAGAFIALVFSLLWNYQRRQSDSEKAVMHSQ
jgi:hypothetical protein